MVGRRAGKCPLFVFRFDDCPRPEAFNTVTQVPTKLSDVSAIPMSFPRKIFVVIVRL
jgi:hypothetical protein